jgi:hypothetical protein
MSTTLRVRPGTLNVIATAGQAFSQLVDFSIDLTGYTFTAEIVSAVTLQSVSALTVTDVDLEVGQINVGMTEEDSAGVAAGTYLWRLVWTPANGDARTALEGVWEASR